MQEQEKQIISIFKTVRRLLSNDSSFERKQLKGGVRKKYAFYDILYKELSKVITWNADGNLKKNFKFPFKMRMKRDIIEIFSMSPRASYLTDITPNYNKRRRVKRYLARIRGAYRMIKSVSIPAKVGYGLINENIVYSDHTPSKDVYVSLLIGAGRTKKDRNIFMIPKSGYRAYPLFAKSPLEFALDGSGSEDPIVAALERAVSLYTQNLYGG